MKVLKRINLDVFCTSAVTLSNVIILRATCMVLNHNQCGKMAQSKTGGNTFDKYNFVQYMSTFCSNHIFQLGKSQKKMILDKSCHFLFRNLYSTYRLRATRWRHRCHFYFYSFESIEPSTVILNYTPANTFFVRAKYC